MNRCYLGLDLGTSGMKAGIFDHQGRLLGDLYWNTRLVPVSPDAKEIDPDTILAQAFQIITAVIQRAHINTKSITGVAISGQMGGIVGVDEAGDSITGFDMGLDIRSEAYNQRFHEIVGEKVFSETFGSPRNTPKIMRWKKEHPEVYRKIRKFVTLNSYISAKLVGLPGDDSYIDYTQLAFFGNEDARKLQWSEELTAACDLDVEKFPTVVRPLDTIGGITQEMAQKTSLRKGTPVFAGSGDQPAGLLGARFTRNSSLIDVSGTTTLLFCATNDFIPDVKHHSVMYMPSIIEHTYAAFTYINGGGLTLKWFRDEFAPDLSWEDLASQITAIPPGSHGLLFSPYFGGRQCPYHASIRGSWIGMNWNHTKYHLYRALLEGLCYDYAIGKEQLSTLLPVVDTRLIEGIGGGAKDAVWNQMKADVMNITYHQKPYRQCTLRGCALTAAYGAGEVGDFSAWDHCIEDEIGITFSPNKAAHAKYIPYIETFRKLFTSDLLEIFHELNTFV
jgi:xylulokinase